MTVTAPPKLAVESLRKVFTTAAGENFTALHDIDLEVADGEFVAIIGLSGCGKSTLLSLIAGLIAPTDGRITVGGRPVKGPGRDRGMIFQQDAILMWRRVEDNVAYGLALQGIPKAERREITARYIRMVGLEGFERFFPKELSGGMRKRVAIATVFANNPDVLLLDEPFGALDYVTKISLHGELLDLWERERHTTVFVTHDIEEALFLADRIVVMAAGRIVADVQVPFGRPRLPEVRTSPEMQEHKQRIWDLMQSE